MKLRICWPLNLAIQRERFKIPTLDDIATRLSGATAIFSKLDANHEYWQVPLDNASQLLATSVWMVLFQENASFWHQISTRSIPEAHQCNFRWPSRRRNRYWCYPSSGSQCKRTWTGASMLCSKDAKTLFISLWIKRNASLACLKWHTLVTN